MASLYQHPPRPLPPPSPNTQHIVSASADEDRLINRSLLDSLDGPLDPLDSYSSHSSDTGASSRNPASANNLTNASTPASGSHAASPTLPFRSVTLHPHPPVNSNSNNNTHSSNNNSNTNTTSQLSQQHHQFNFNHHPDSPPYPFASSLYNSIHVPDTFRDHSNQLDDKFTAFETAPYRTTTSFTNPRRQLNGNHSSSHYADQQPLYPSVADVFGPPTKQQHLAAEHAATEHLASRMNERDATGNKQPPPSTQTSGQFTSGVPPAAALGNGSSLLQPPHAQPGALSAASQALQPPGAPQSQSSLTQAQAQQTLAAAAQYFSVMQNQAQPGLPGNNPVLNGAVGAGQPPFTNQTQQTLNPLPGGNMGSAQVATLAQQLASLNLPGAERDRGRDGHNPPQEEISTIFVVGFPPDMQEREFQNMFTFSPGFEAATLKIPNKELGTYGTAAPGAPPPGAPNSAALGFMPQLQNAQSQYAGANDPYNLVTVNSGGVVVDAAGSATTTAAWPTGLTNPGANSATAAGVPNGTGTDDAFARSGLAPAAAPADLNHLPGATSRKIIGFAKFRTRTEALEARDVLQGRCVDVEKGAVLKAEMAKKNLHTKRGVGPLGLPLTLMGPGGVVGPETLAGLANLTSLTGMVPAPPVPPTETLTQRERDLGALGAMGLGSATHHARSRERDRDREDEERQRRDHERERDLSRVREGRERDRGVDRDQSREAERFREREREREREAERNLRARMGAAASYDALRANGASSTATITAGPHNILGSPDALGFQFTSGGNMGPNGPVPPGLNSAGLLQLSSGWPTNPVKPNDGLNGINGMTKVNGLTTNLPPRPPSSLQHSPPEPQSHPSSGSSVRASLPNENTLSPRNGTHSLPSHPSLPSRPMSHRSYSPPESQPPFPPQHPGVPPPQHPFPVHQASMPHQHSHPGSHPTSSASSANGSMDGDPGRTAAPMSVGTHHGMTSPQLPSPGSGTGGGNPRDIRANAADQNPPINTLYVGNLPTSPPNTHPANYLEDALLQLFSRCPGYRKLCFRQKSNGPMCFVEFEDVSYATKALNDLYGNTLNGFVKGGIRLSFSKNPLGVRGQNHPSRAENNMGSINSQLFNPALSGLPDNFHAQRQNVPPSSAIIDIGRMRQEPPGADMHMTGTSPPSRFYSPPSAPIASIFGTSPPNNAGVRSLQAGFGRTTYNPPNLSNNGFSPFAVNPAAQAQQHHHVAMLSNGDMPSLTSREHLPHSPNMEAT